MSTYLTVSRADAIATVTLTQPTMPPALFGECEAVFGELAEDREVRAVVIQGAGRGFSYGLDLKAAFGELGPVLGGGGLAPARDQLRRLILDLQRGITAVATCPVPVIAAVHGHCIGGGLDLITACDLRVAAADAVFSLRETKMAMVADLGSLQRLPAIVGRGIARELAFTGGDLDAERALRVGLVNHVAADAAGAQAAAAGLAAEIAANPPLTVRGVKQVLDYSAGKSVAEGLEYVATWNAAFLASADLQEALAAFLERRAPVFRGE